MKHSYKQPSINQALNTGSKENMTHFQIKCFRVFELASKYNLLFWWQCLPYRAQQSSDAI